MTVHIDYAPLAAPYARHRQVHPEVLHALCAAIRPRDRVLEVGCGSGNYAGALVDLTGCSCWGIDPASEMLAQARKRSPAVHLSLGRAEQTAFAPASFDLVFSVDVIHHVQDRPRSYREACRILKPGGRICTVTDSEWIIRHRRPLSVYFSETVEVELRRYPRIAQLRAWMEGAGLVEIDEQMVEHFYALTDIQAYRDKAFSALHLISEPAFRRGLDRLADDLRRAPLPCVSRYTLLWGRRPALANAHGACAHEPRT
jgi:ubiquinone/menaquinone biosynthesis C-methylase UbiE